MSQAMSTPPNLASARALREALRLVDHGYHLTPVTIRRNEKGEKQAKFHANWKRDPLAISTDHEVVKDWAAQYSCSFAVVCGPSGVEGVDLDVKPDKNGLVWWAEQGLPMGKLIVDTPSGGAHSYWRRRSDRTLPTNAGEVAPGVDTRSNGGVFFAPGAFVLDVEGEPEAESYTIIGELVAVDDLDYTPGDILDMWAAKKEEREQPEYEGETDPDRRYTQAQATEWVKEHAIGPLLQAGAEGEGRRNDALNVAAVVVGHFLPHFWSVDWATSRLTAIALEIGLDPKEIGPTIRSGLSAGMAHRYTKVDQPDPFESASDGSATTEDAYQKALAAERIRRQVRAELDAENRPALARLSFSEFLNAATPDYLVPKMFYRDGLSVVFGPPGAAKSFLLLDVALSLATETPWRGRSIGRGRVHYIMAEGQATNTLRTRAWLKHRNVDPKLAEDWFIPYSEPIMLTEHGISDYLRDVEKDQPDMIILDTKNLMFDGKESQGDDYGQMLRALHKMRRAAGGAAVVLIDHSGLGDDTRTRGSNAQKGGVETEVRVTDANGVRRAEITRDKSGEIGTEWLYKLEQVHGVPRPKDVTPPAVCVALDADDVPSESPFGRFEDWNDLTQPSVPIDVGAYSGPGASAIKALARFMRYNAGGSVGFSLTQARKAVQEVYRNEKDKPMWSADTIDRAWGALVDLNRLEIADGSSPTGRSLWKTHPGDPE